MEALLVALTILAGAMIQPARNHDRQQAQQAKATK
jgi:hypothetical protein